MGQENGQTSVRHFQRLTPFLVLRGIVFLLLNLAIVSCASIDPAPVSITVSANRNLLDLNPGDKLTIYVGVKNNTSGIITIFGNLGIAAGEGDSGLCLYNAADNTFIEPSLTGTYELDFEAVRNGRQINAGENFVHEMEFQIVRRVESERKNSFELASGMTSHNLSGDLKYYFIYKIDKITLKDSATNKIVTIDCEMHKLSNRMLMELRKKSISGVGP